MPRFKTIEISAYTKTGYQKLKTEVNIDANGRFYCNLEEQYLHAVKEAFNDYSLSRSGKIKASEKVFKTLEDNLKRMLEIHFSPIKTEELVIRYNIESHIHFAYDNEGNVYSNGYLAGNAKGDNWNWSDKEKYGETGCFSKTHEGYKLIIGAKAMLKTTYKYGETEKIDYKYYNGNKRNASDYESPATKLNSWTNMDIGRHPKEIPYSDKAALFFHNLLTGMAKLSKMIQEATFNQNDLLILIEKNQLGLLQLPDPEDSDVTT